METKVLRDDQLDFLVKTLPDCYKAFGTSQTHPWRSADDRTEARTALEATVTKARDALRTLDQHGPSTPPGRKLKADLIFWCEFSARTLAA